ncbi:MAG: Gfo/Idh/MocA family oxidoreductase [Phycisphaerales bacterium]|nr:Gfo/Idh/MocA family oxidoreductase [Phycisphaerales bacterium]
MKPVRVLIIGAGSRGTAYSQYIQKHPEDAVVVGVADPDEFKRNRIAEMFGIPDEHVWDDWTGPAAGGKLADAAIIATPDSMHVEPAIALAGQGYHLLLEKPVATNEADCRRVIQAVQDRGDIHFAICHVLRYTKFTQTLKSILDSGRIGQIVNVQHLEPVGYWHQAHAFVRGNWRNEAESSFMLLAKSCHDIDWIGHVIGKPCRRVSSFGSLFHFTKANQPEGAADRCVDCGVEADCPYSATKIYMGMLEKGQTGWPLDVLAGEVNAETITEAIRIGPYGRCAYACDNDVVDHQVVNMEYDGGATASFTMTAFNMAGSRKTRIHGTRGEIYGDGEKIIVTDFLTDQTETIDTSAADGTMAGGHGGGDDGIMLAFLGAVSGDTPEAIVTGPQESLETHLAVFAAERARLNGSVETISL